MKFLFFLFIILNSLNVFAQNDLDASPNFSTYYKRTGQLNQQIKVSDSIYNSKSAQKFKNDSISFAREKNKKEDNSEQLEPVYLTSKNTFEYGYHQRKGFFGRLFHKRTKVLKYVNNNPYQKAVYFKDSLSNKTLLIKEVLLRTWSDKPDSLATLQVHLYPIDIEHQKIGHDLLKNCTVQLDAKRHGLKRVDISSEQIYMPAGGILLSVENLNPNEKTDLEWKFNKKFEESNSYWIKIEGNQTKIFQLPKSSLFYNYNYMFGISVEVK